MYHDLLLAIWFLLPVAAANMTPIFAAALPVVKNWSAPMDGGHSWRGKRIFGDHKTWRGLITGILAGILVLWLQQVLYRHQGWAHTMANGIDYQSLPTILFGALFGIGAIGGDALESFFKRQRGIPSGHTWVPFDQLDYIIGGILVSLPFAILSVRQYILVIMFWFVAHLVASVIGWMVGLKPRPI